jgi:hypothetical protein
LIRLPLLIAGILSIIHVLTVIDVDVITVEVVVDVNVAIHVYVRMVVSAPTAPVSPIAVIRNNRARSHTKTKTHSRARHGIVRRINVAGICNRITSINHRRAILRDINDVRLRWLNLNYLVGDKHSLLIDDVRNHRIGDINDLLLGRFKRAGALSLRSHSLDRVSHAFRLINKRVAQVARPLNVVVHLINDIGEFGDRFDIVVPCLRIQLRDVIRVFHEPRSLHDFQRIRRCR